MPKPRVRAAWEYPDCPECETPVLVAGTSSAHDEYECHGCGAVFRPSLKEATDD